MVPRNSVPVCTRTHRLEVCFALFTVWLSALTRKQWHLTIYTQI